MIAKYLLPFIILISLFSCTHKDFEKKLVLKPLPSQVYLVVDESNKLKDYASKLSQIDLDQNLSKLKNKTEKEKFKYRITEFKIAYNKCVDKITEIEGQKAKDKTKQMRELKEDMMELDTIWQYIIANYQI